MDDKCIPTFVPKESVGSLEKGGLTVHSFFGQCSEFKYLKTMILIDSDKSISGQISGPKVSQRCKPTQDASGTRRLSAWRDPDVILGQWPMAITSNLWQNIVKHDWVSTPCPIYGEVPNFSNTCYYFPGIPSLQHREVEYVVGSVTQPRLLPQLWGSQACWKFTRHFDSSPHLLEKAKSNTPNLMGFSPPIPHKNVAPNR